jgi:hypothetical protein
MFTLATQTHHRDWIFSRTVGILMQWPVGRPKAILPGMIDDEVWYRTV